MLNRRNNWWQNDNNQKCCMQHALVSFSRSLHSLHHAFFSFAPKLMVHTGQRCIWLMQHHSLLCCPVVFCSCLAPDLVVHCKTSSQAAKSYQCWTLISEPIILSVLCNFCLTFKTSCVPVERCSIGYQCLTIRWTQYVPQQQKQTHF